MPLARDVKCVVGPEQEELTYEVAQPWPATEGLHRIQETLRKQGWRPMLEDFVNPGVPSSHVVGWRSYLEGDRTVQQWLAQWQNEQGEIVWYALIYRSPEGQKQPTTDLSIKAVRFKAAAAKSLREQGRGQVGGSPRPDLGATAVCDVSERSLQRAARPACAADAAVGAAPLRLGELYNLALLGSATAQADSATPNHAPLLVKDGWYGDCSAWVPRRGEASSAYAELDLGGIFRLSGVAITTELEELGDGASWRVEVLTGLARDALSRIHNDEGPAFKGKRLFSFEPTAARVVRVQLASAGGTPLRTKSGPPRVDEIEVYGECIQ